MSCDRLTSLPALRMDLRLLTTMSADGDTAAAIYILLRRPMTLVPRPDGPRTQLSKRRSVGPDDSIAGYGF